MVRYERDKNYHSQGAIQSGDSFDERNYVIETTKIQITKTFSEDEISNKNNAFKLRKEEIKLKIQKIDDCIKQIKWETSIPTVESIRKIEQLEEKKIFLETEYKRLLNEQLDKIDINQTQVTIDVKEPLRAEQHVTSTHICQFCFNLFEYELNRCPKCGLMLCREHVHDHSCIKYYRIEEQHRHEIVGTYPPRKTLFDKIIKIPFDNLMRKIGFR